MKPADRKNGGLRYPCFGQRKIAKVFERLEAPRGI
jgi:hypothetical protein